MNSDMEKAKRVFREKFDVFFYDLELNQWITHRAETCPMLEMCRGCSKEWRCANYQAPGLTYMWCEHRNQEWRI